MASNPNLKAGPGRYMAEAFKNRWNLLALFGAVGVAVLSPVPDAALLLVAAGEIGFLGLLTANPRFRQAIDASDLKRSAEDEAPKRSSETVEPLLRQLPDADRQRFFDLHTRCRSMLTIARNVRGRVDPDSDRAQLGGLDRLLWTYVRLLLSRAALAQFLDATDEPEILARRDRLKSRLDELGDAGDERVKRSLAESLAAAELREQNYRKAEENAEFLGIEVERIEQSIHALVEMAVNRYDADFLSAQVNATVQSMKKTEETLADLQSLTGLSESTQEAPAILDMEMDYA